MDVKEIVERIKELIGEEGIEELKRLGVPVDTDPEKFLIFLGVVTGALQIVKRGKKFYIRVTPPQNMPMRLVYDKYPERTKKVLELSMRFMTEGRGNPEYVKKKWEELKKKGIWKKEEKLLTEEQLNKLLDRFSLLLPLLFRYKELEREVSKSSLSNTESESSKES